MLNLQPNCCWKVDFQKVDKRTGGKKVDKRTTPQVLSVAKPETPLQNTQVE